ncbi:TolC family outer membrane protein [Aquabacterium lacunae]|uniref:TolC family outer membrane protein n=1 Tax=Aquabacterium lacunae TaxID=2528630 RepID=UPI001FE0A4B7|nr:TolC family outer membrane protein [Aquabacterium lacunae]
MTITSFRLALTTTALAALSCVAQAQQAGLPAAAQKAISTNPEVTARYNALRAAANEQDVARGGLRPQVNLDAEVGRNRDKIDGRAPESQSGSRTGLSLSVNQMLWDGQATRKEVERLGHARLTRYFEFVSATEDSALEASRAYVDVARFRRLVELAEDNYVQHKYVFDQLQSKVKAGVGRGVDSEQANARLSLAESNLTTEIANLHDVSARYLRVVGEPPEAKMGSPREVLARNAFKSNADATVQAMARNSAVTAAIENVRAAEAQAESRDGAFQPRVEARLRTGAGRNYDGQTGQRNDTLGQIVLNWNLYNGGSDQARVRQFADLLNQAQDLRDKACRDVRQTAAIAQNDIGKLKDQLTALDRNVLAIEKARDAYRQQFDIGQRSLLDLLNAENELYTAKRAYANAEHDLMLAQARTLAVTNTLVSSLGLSRTDDGSADLAANWQAAEDAAQRCPNVVIDPKATAREELDARAKRMAGPAVATPVAAPAPAVEPMATEANVKTVEDRLRDWVATWMAKDINKYFTFYAKEFAPARYTSAKWIAERRRLVTKPGEIDIKVSDVKASAQGPYVVTSFKQVYNSKDFKDVSQKTLTWRYVDNDWIIFKESNR